MKKNPKISKGRANYGPSGSDRENCKSCRFYLYDTSGNNQHKCQVVEGFINPSFISDLYQPQVDFGDNGVTPEAFPVVIENPSMKSTKKFNKARKIVEAFNSKVHKQFGTGVKRVKKGKQDNPQLVAIFTMGLPAAGKSTLVKGRYGNDENWTIVDPDAIAEGLPGYDPKAPQLVHAQASKLAEEAFKYTIENKITNLVLDTTGTKADKLVRRMKEARKAGYKIRLLFVTVPLEISLARNNARDRTVPESVVLEKAAMVNEAFNTAKKTADEVEVVDNSPIPMGVSSNPQGNPLLPGFTREVVSENISREIRAGKEQDEAVAISLNNARREFRKENKRGRFPKHLQDRRGKKNPKFPTLKGLPVNAIIQFPSGRWGFTGKVSGELAFVNKDGGPPTEKQLQDAREFGPGLIGIKGRAWDTKKEALAAAKRLGVDVTDPQTPEEKKEVPKKAKTAKPPVQKELKSTARTIKRKSRKLLTADRLADFQVGRDKVVRRGESTFVVDTKGERADTQVVSDVLDKETVGNLQKLSGEIRDKAIVSTRSTPFLSDEGKRERLDVIRDVMLRERGIEPKSKGNPPFAEHVAAGEKWAVEAEHRGKKVTAPVVSAKSKDRIVTNFTETFRISGNDVAFPVNHGFSFFVFRLPEKIAGAGQWAIADTSSGAWFASSGSQKESIKRGDGVLRSFSKEKFSNIVKGAVKAAARGKEKPKEVKGLPSGGQILTTAPSNLVKVFDLPFRAITRKPGQSKRLVEIAVRAVEAADKVASTNSHPSIKVIERLQELMTDEELREWASQIGGLIPFHNKFVRERLVREANGKKQDKREIPTAPTVSAAAINENYPPGVNPNDIPFTLAMQAHSGTSFVPDERARGEQTQYVEHMKAVWQRLIAVASTDGQKKTALSEFGKYRENWAGKYRSLLSARGGLVSTMIAGPSGFNVRRAEKKNNSYTKKLDEFLKWDKRAQAKMREAVNPATARSISADRSDATEALQTKIDSAKKDQEQWKGLNTIVKSKKLSDAEKIAKVMADFGFKEQTAQNLLEKDFAGRAGIPSYMLTNNNANIRRMEARIAEITTTRGTAPLETSFPGGSVSENADNNRLQIFFDEKPDIQVRIQLKKNGFKWSPREGAWQRQRGQNARFALKQAIGVSLTDAEPVREHEVEESIEFTPDMAEPPNGNREANPMKNPSCPSCNNPIKNPSTLTPGNYTCSGCSSSITIAKANPIHEDTSLGEKFGGAIVLGAGLATGSVIANKVLSGKKKNPPFVEHVKAGEPWAVKAAGKGKPVEKPKEAKKKGSVVYTWQFDFGRVGGTVSDNFKATSDKQAQKVVFDRIKAKAFRKEKGLVQARIAATPSGMLKLKNDQTGEAFVWTVERGWETQEEEDRRNAEAREAFEKRNRDDIGRGFRTGKGGVLLPPGALENHTVLTKNGDRPPGSSGVAHLLIVEDGKITISDGATVGRTWPAKWDIKKQSWIVTGDGQQLRDGKVVERFPINGKK